MARYNQKLDLIAGKNKYSFSSSSSYKDIFDITQELDNGAAPAGGSSEFYQLVELGTSKGRNKLEGAKTICIHNEGKAAAEISLRTQLYDGTANTEKTGTVSSTESGTEVVWWTTFNMILSSGEYMLLPHNRAVSYTRDNSTDPGVVTSAGNQTQVLDTIVSGLTSYGSSGVASGVGLAEGLDTSETGVDVEDGDVFMVGDYIRVENEIMRVTAVATNTLTVERGVLGSTIATHDLGVTITYHIYNHLVEYNDHTIVQTNDYGDYKGSTFFGQGRNSAGDGVASNIDGVQPGSIAIQFYTIGGYQECGLSNKTLGESTGLSASTAYYLKITQDALAQQEITITTGTTVTYQDVLALIQTAIDSNTVLQRVSVGLVGGDVRFTSGTNKSTTAIALAAGTTGTNMFVTGDFNVTQDLAVPATIKDSSFRNYKNIETKLDSDFLYDDGRGNLNRVGGGGGSINYETGEIYFTNCPTNSEFKVSYIFGSAMTGGDAELGEATGAQGNIIDSIYARSLNPKVNAKIRLLAMY